MRFIPSILMSILASVLGTYLLRRVIPGATGQQAREGEAQPASNNVSVVVVVMPVVVGNTWALGAPGILRHLLRRRRRRMGWKRAGKRMRGS